MAGLPFVYRGFGLYRQKAEQSGDPQLPVNFEAAFGSRTKSASARAVPRAR
jgi:hypothetical protein